MKRSHSGFHGWRNENRYFSPRGGGNPYFRSRPYPLHDVSFPPPIPRLNKVPFVPRPSHVIDQYAEQNRNKFRYENRRSNNSRPCDKQSHRQTMPQIQKFNTKKKSYKEPHYREITKGITQRDKYHGDHRRSNNSFSHRSFEQQSVSPVVHRTEYKHPEHKSINPNKTHRNNENVNNLTIQDYPAHRPLSSDHYGSNPTTSIDNTNTFSCSVDDTVHIVRKKLLGRNESLHSLDNLDLGNHNHDSQQKKFSTSFDNQQEQTRRRAQKQNPPKNANCDKIKNNIVHQLFKMDKEKIHKLLDNPNSSSKFEYAISSLITESQNSYNRHLRSIAEKSLCSTSTDFIQNGNNTLYEDTFLKQMQCLLDPQDSVILEDIKPIVMAELSKALRLDDFEQQYLENEMKNDEHANEEYYKEEYDFSTMNIYDNMLQENNLVDKQIIVDYQTQNVKKDTDETCNDYESNEKTVSIPKNLERRLRTRSCTYNEKRSPITESVRCSRHSVDQKLNEDIFNNIDPATLFDPFHEQLPEGEDPFAELDNQYHVAVDHNLIFMENIPSPIPPQRDDIVKSPIINTCQSNTENTDVTKRNQKTDSQTLDTTKSPLKLSLDIINKNDIDKEKNKYTGIIQNTLNVNKNINSMYTCEAEEAPKEGANNIIKDSGSPTSFDITKSLTSSNPRKRPIEQQSSHRKEKRKKIEPTPQVFNKPKTKIANVNGRTPKISEKASKTDKFPKEYLNKHITHKNLQKNPKNVNDPSKTGQNSVSSSHCSSDLKNDIVTVTNSPTKTDPKNVLTTIDMFSEKPKKVNIHQAHRNTAVKPSTSNTSIIIEKDNLESKPSSPLKTKYHVATQTVTKQLAKETQTIDIENSFNENLSQTEENIMYLKEVQTTDPSERIRQIDLEIQVLLQEKFELSKLLENQEPESLQTLGVTVLNMSPFDVNLIDNCINVYPECGDVILNDFTSIPPVLELDNEALDSVSTEKTENFTKRKRGRPKSNFRQEMKKSLIPKTKRKYNRRSTKSNILVNEQIVTDDQSLTTRNESKKVSHRRKNLTKEIEQINFEEMNIIEIKDCSVVLEKVDLNTLLAEYTANLNGSQELQYEQIRHTNNVEREHSARKENVDMNDLQIDMLDVSEQIVVGDNCEIKSLQDRELEIVEVPINEEVIIDNSQLPENIVPPQTLIGDIECKMYDYSADENLRHDIITVTGNADAVLAIECVDNNFIAACLDGNVYYFSGDGQLINTLRGSNLAVTCLTIVKEKYGTTVYTGSLDSRLRYYDLETGLEKGPECIVLSPIQSMDRAWDTVFVGTKTGFILRFECKNNILIPISTVKFSNETILALRAMKEGPRKVLLVAARSENVTIRDAQTGLLLRTLEGPKMTVYTLLYEDGKVFCGTSSHLIQVFDYTSGNHVGVREGGKGVVCLRTSGGLLFAGCYDGCIYVYRDGEPQPMAQLRGPGLMLLSLAIVGSKIIAGYKDRGLYIWKIPLSILKEMIL